MAADKYCMKQISRICHGKACLLFVVGASFLLAAGEDQPSAYRADVAEVRLTFFATGQNRQSLATLSDKDFAVLDQDLIVRNFASFGRVIWTSLDVAVILDSSESVASQIKKEMADTLGWMTRNGEIPQENFSLVSFHGPEPLLICAGNCWGAHDASQLPPTTGGFTPLFDSVVFAADLVSRRAPPHARKVLILLSDGEDTISRNAVADAIDAALADDVAIYDIDMNPPGHASEGRFILQRLASATGGRYFSAKHGGEELLNALLEDLHGAYTVTYRVPDRTVGFHSVRILATHDSSLHFYCRSGYQYLPNSHP